MLAFGQLVHTIKLGILAKFIVEVWTVEIMLVYSIFFLIDLQLIFLPDSNQFQRIRRYL